jgi:SAM-dependent methyltransferase
VNGGGPTTASIPVGRNPRNYSLSEFQAEFLNSRPDLDDVRRYNHKMLEIFAGLRSFKHKLLLDIGASPHGFALERALELGVREYYGIGLGIPFDIAVQCSKSSWGMLFNMNAEQMAFPSEAFDLIITLSTFEHFFHPSKVLSEMHRVLKPGGAVLIDFQPIWTSIRGHHLHHIPEVCKLLPPWSHLVWTKEELIENLGATWPSGCSMTIEQVAHWIYESDEINRLDIKILRNALQNSPLAVEWLTPHADDLSESELAVASKLSATVPYSVDDLKIRGFSALLVRG